MMKRMAVLPLFLTTLASAGFAGEGAVPKGIPHFDHVFLIMMENHGYSQTAFSPFPPPATPWE